MEIWKIVSEASVIIGALLAIDNIVDGVFKAFGYKEGDTFCGQIAELLNRTQKQLPMIKSTDQKAPEVKP